MENILKYENRDLLYDFLIEDFGLSKVDEHYNPELFGNFYITLSAGDFLVSYVNDRAHLIINITSILEPQNWLPLSFVKNLLYDPRHINSSDLDDNLTRIKKLNDFLKKDFQTIANLFSPKNYFDTKRKIEMLLQQQFKKDNPGLLE